MNKRISAFTLIELLIVVAIIGILAAIAVPNFLNAQTRAKVAKVVSNLRSIETALEMYYLDENSYTSWAWDGNDYYGFRQLSTPIAYINSSDAFLNPFKGKNMFGEYAATGAELDPMFELGTYFAKGGGTYVSQYPNNTWILASPGPTMGDSYNEGNLLTTVPVYYQPTNGIRSLGGIIRMGGAQLPSWYQLVQY